jgi:iron complex transport system ATP-binding protein
MDVEGEVWLALPPQLRAQRMGYLPQQPQLAWDMKVEEVVALGLTPWPNMPGAVRQRQVQAALERCDAAGFAGRRYQALSGGQRQRVMLARAMAGKPGLLLLDEPCANLDPEQQLRLMALFLRLVKEGLTLWMVCHDVALASRFCHHILLFDGKGLAAQGTVKQVFDAENLRHCFGIEAKTVGNTKETCILPWRPAG